MGDQKITWIFDYDDTLSPCEPHYYSCISDLHTYVTQCFGSNGSRAEMQALAEEENVRIIDERGGFFKDIFPESFEHIYRKLAKNHNAPILPEHIQEVRSIAESVFDENRYRNTLYPGVRETILFLQNKGDETRIYTKGDESVQRMKIRVNDLEELFAPHTIHVTQNKSTSEFREIVADRDINSVIAVGNSVRSDINPATEAGAYALHFDNGVWAYEGNHKGVLHPDRVLKIAGVFQITQEYDQIISRLNIPK